MRIIQQQWFTEIGEVGSIGLILAENEHKEVHLYIGKGTGLSETADIKKILETGAKAPPDILNAFLLQNKPVIPSISPDYTLTHKARQPATGQYVALRKTKIFWIDGYGKKYRQTDGFPVGQTAHKRIDLATLVMMKQEDWV